MSFLSVNYIEFYVSNLPCVQFLFSSILAFKIDPSSSQIKNNNTSFISRNDINLVFSSNNHLNNLFKQVSLFGDFIKNIVFEVELEDIEQAINNAKIKAGYLF